MESKKIPIDQLKILLNPTDKAYCDKLFKKYEDLQRMTFENFRDGYRQIHEYNRDNKEDNPFEEECNILASYIDKIASSMIDQSKSVVSKIEDYFRKKYSLEFPSLLDVNKYAIDSMIEYDAVIKNMINQTKKDFSKEME
jgi:hypothetical protein